MTFFDIWCIFNHFFIEILCLGLHFSIQVCLHFNWCVTAGKIENIHLPMQVPFCKIQKTIQGPKELNEKIDNLHWQCKSPSGTRIVPVQNQVRIYIQAPNFMFYKVIRSKRIVFCYQNCSDLLWEKIVLVIEKNFWNSRLKAENLLNFWDY